jgi:DNA-binding response OmpR family regulator
MIYIIEDDKSITRGFELFLQSANMNFHSFTSVSKFLEEGRPELHDVIVLDLNLPGVPGSYLLQKMDEEGSKIPVIVVTAFDDEKNRRMGRLNCVKAYLRKPVDAEALIDIIKFNMADNS